MMALYVQEGPSVVSENQVHKLIAIFNKVVSDERLVQQLRVLWCKGPVPSEMDAKVAAEAEAEVTALKLYVKQTTEATALPPPLSPEFSIRPKLPVRIYADGVFDLMHSGHFNALRQAKALGDKLVVGVNSDAEVLRAKGGRPIYTQEERGEIIRGCKWVDDVVIGTSYSVSLDLLKRVGCEYVAHGDDFVADADGDDCYAEPRSAGRLKMFKRTEGISTTTLVSRLLLATQNLDNPVAVESPKTVQRFIEESLCSKKSSRQSLMSTKRLLQFIGQGKQPRVGDRIVYVDGSFDVFHVGHLRILQKAKELGDYLIVGIHDDATVHRVKGTGFPVMNLLERALNVLAMRVVDEVIIGAPWFITEYLIKAFYIDVVVRGTRIDAMLPRDADSDELPEFGFAEDPYEVPKRMGIYREVESSSSLTTREIIQRIVENRITLLSCIRNRSKKEENHWQQQEIGVNSIIREI